MYNFGDNIVVKNNRENIRASFDLRNQIKNGTIDLTDEFDREVAQGIYDDLPLYATYPLIGFGLKYSEAGTIMDEFTQWSLDNPCRLTGESMKRDYMNGPKAMVDGEYFNRSADQANWDHLNMMKQLREERFFRLAEMIMLSSARKLSNSRTGKEITLTLGEVAYRYWDEAINKETSKNYLAWEKAGGSGEYLWFTKDQKAMIAELLNTFHKPNGAKKGDFKKFLEERRQAAFETEMSEGRGLENLENYEDDFAVEYSKD